MTITVRQIESAAELLSLMHESPSTRRIESIYSTGDWGNFFKVVSEQPGANAPHGRTLAEIVRGSEAEKLCDAATLADAKPDPEIWACLPLRHRVIGNAWLLPEHPEAPQQPGGLAQAHRALDALFKNRASKRSLWGWLRGSGNE
jgi:hypothetical protein